MTCLRNECFLAPSTSSLMSSGMPSLVLELTNTTLRMLVSSLCACVMSCESLSMDNAS